MNLNKSTLIIYSMLGIIAMLIGALVNQFNYYQARIAEWKLAINKCMYVTEKQEDIIEDAMSAFKR